MFSDEGCRGLKESSEEEVLGFHPDTPQQVCCERTDELRFKGNEHMVSNITNATQLSTFSIIKGILRTSSTMNVKFRDGSYLNYEPELKSISFNMLPYIVINNPTTETELVTYTNEMTSKEFIIEIVMVMSYDARSNFLTYANELINTIEGAETTFETSGYYDASIDLISVVPEFIKQKKVVTGTFELTLNGSVIR